MQVVDGIAGLAGDLTMQQATRLLAEAEQALAGGAHTFDLAGCGQVDSSALSLLLSIRRRSAGARFIHLPDSLISLAQLYGVTELV
jgi:ABC-type transporter Mla MlaB component